uniref:Uncharacterized protein n=1 Tax=Solanum lycopersicum TaxID=4081 RepID=A0A3Q7ITH8_SOLLC
MPVVLQIWIYECMGKRQTNFARKINDRIPRILNWKTVGAKPRFKTLMKDTFNDDNRENGVPSLMEITVLQLPPEGVEKSTEGVQTEPHHDIDEQVLAGHNSDDDFVNPPPPSMKVTCKRKKGQSVSPAKRIRKKE